MSQRWQWAWIALLLAPLVGCGPTPVVGGTSGVLRAGGEPLGDMQLTVYQSQGGGWTPIGFADTDAEGKFRLLLNEARGPLELQPGEYRVTLQSVGAPVLVPKELMQVDATPLLIQWPTAEPQLDLSLPQKLARLRR